MEKRDVTPLSLGFGKRIHTICFNLGHPSEDSLKKIFPHQDSTSFLECTYIKLTYNETKLECAHSRYQ